MRRIYIVGSVAHSFVIITSRIEELFATLRLDFNFFFIAGNSSMHVVSLMSHKILLPICRSILALCNCFVLDTSNPYFLISFLSKLRILIFAFLSSFLYTLGLV